MSLIVALILAAHAKVIPGKTIDLHLPEGKTSAALAFLHGGAWISGDKSEYAAIAPPFVNQGIAVALVSYPLSDESKVRHPEHAESAAREIEKLRERFSKIVVVGHSAGAHMAAWIAGNSSPKVNGFVGLEGIYDVPKLAKKFPTYSDWFLKKAFGPPKSWRKASPSHRPVEQKVPWLVVHSEGDELVDLAQSERYHAHLLGAKVPAQLLKLKELRHFAVVRALEDPKSELTLKILEFVKGIP